MEDTWSVLSLAKSIILDIHFSVFTMHIYLNFCCHNFSAYGKGAYFARDASYSDRYTDKACCMFRSKVLIGKYVDGDSNMQRPPTLPGKN